MALEVPFTALTEDPLIGIDLPNPLGLLPIPCPAKLVLLSEMARIILCSCWRNVMTFDYVMSVTVM